MIVLAIDSSADLISVAVLQDRAPLAERSHKAARPRSEGVLALVESVLADAEVALTAVDLFAVATGPGSFNGIRGGIATAEGLALALDRPVVGVPTLDAIAYAHIGRAPVLLAVLPAGRADYYAASYDGNPGAWRRRGAYVVAPLDTALAGLAPDGMVALVCGSVSPDAQPLVAQAGLRRAPLFAELPRALSVGALAMDQASGGYADRDRPVEPLYLRRPGITQPTRSTRFAATAGRATRAGVERTAETALSVRSGVGAEKDA